MAGGCKTPIGKGAAATSESRAKWAGSARGRWRSESPGWPPALGRSRWPRRPCPRPRGCFPAGSGSTGLSTRKSRTISSLIPSPLACSDSGRTGSGSVALPFCFRFFPFALTPVSISSPMPGFLVQATFQRFFFERHSFQASPARQFSFSDGISTLFFEALFSTVVSQEIYSSCFAAISVFPFQLGSSFHFGTASFDSSH